MTPGELKTDQTPGPLRPFLDGLEGVERKNGYYRALCPAHADHDPSLDFGWGEDKEKVWLICRSRNCDVNEILKQLGLDLTDLYENGSSSREKKKIVATYDYLDLQGRLLFQVVRYVPKNFKQRRPDGNGGWIWTLKGLEPVLYRLPEVMRAVLSHQPVFICEGEKDADRAREELGVTATTCPMGASKWRSSYTHVLRGADVVLIPDRDSAGRNHVLTVARELDGIANSIKVLDLPHLPEKGDVSDWIDLGGTREEFDRLVLETPEFDSAHKGEELGQNESLPVKTVSEVLAESGEGPHWKVKSLLARGNITDLSGEAKLSGKTTLAMHMIACLLEGKDFLGFSTRESKVLYLTEQGNNFAEALQKAGLLKADGKLFVVQHKDVRAVDWRALVSRAVQECGQLGVDVLVIDTFAAFSGIVGAEENNSGDIRDKMAPLKEAAQEHDLAVLYVRHAGKSGRARGSSQFEAEGDILLSLKHPEGNHDGNEKARVLEGIGRYDEIPRKLTIELTDNGYVALGSNEQIQFGKAIELIKDLLPSTPEEGMTQDELFKALKDEGVARTTAQRALKWLVNETKEVREEGKGVKGDPHRYWVPPEGPLPPTPIPEPDGGTHSAQTPTPNGRNELKGDKGGGRSSSSTHIPEEPEAERDASTSGFITNPEQLVTEVVPALKVCSEVALDIETTDLSPFKGETRIISLHADDRTHLIDCFAVDPSPALEAIKDKLLYVHGAEFDLPFLYHAYRFIPAKTPIDTLHLSQVVRAGEWDLKEDGGWHRIKHSLKEALLRELGVKLGDKTKYQRGTAWRADLAEEHAQYATNDVVHLKPLAEKLFTLLKERKLEETWKLEQRAKPLFLEMCYRGVPFDKERWDQLVGELEESVFALKEHADNLAPSHPEGETWNWFSPKQAKEAFKLAGLNVPNLQRQTLSRYENPFVKAVSEYRDAQNELSRARTWYEGRYKDGRVYPQWNPGGTVTGRASCKDPNIQSLTKEGGYRSCIRP